MFVKLNSVALWQRSFIVVVVFLALIYCFDLTKVFAGGVSGGGFSKELFTDAPYDEYFYDRLKKEKQDPTIVRGRYVRVKFDYLIGKDIPHEAEAIKLNLFYDVSHTVVKERVEKRSAQRYTWFGHIKDVKHSQVILVVENGSMAGNITVEGKMYQIRKIGDGVHIICEIDQSAFPEEAPPIPVETPDTSDLAPPTSQADDGSIIDVMVVYTDDVAIASGDIAAEIQLAIDETNQSYANSGINQRLRLVHSQEVDYDETGNMSTDLNCITSPFDGCLDQIHAWRNSYGADLVCLWVENGGDFCGLAWLMQTVSNTFESSGFSVVDRGCATGNFSFGHELGHNMGATHNRANASVQGAFPYSFGYQASPFPNIKANGSGGHVNISKGDQLAIAVSISSGNFSSGNWRTIMAFNCPGGCPRLQYWSNPDVTLEGVPMGVPEGEPDAADNRKTLNNTALTISNFRLETFSCTFSISPTSKSFSLDGGTGSVNVNTSTGCDWTAVNNDSWITITSGSSGTGDGTVNYSVDPNTGTSSRTGTMTIAGKTFTVTQVVTCTYTISPTSQSFSSVGGSYSSVSVTAPTGCDWTAINNDSWITITSGSSGTGDGTVNYSVSPNTSASLRTGTITIVGKTFTVTQAGGTNADWWVAVDTPFGWFYFDLSVMNFVPAGASHTALVVTHQGPLFNLIPPFEVLNISASVLPPGTYTFYFAVDTIMNGILDLDQLFSDFVEVVIP